MEIKKANEIMRLFNGTFEVIKLKKEEFEDSRWQNENSQAIHSGLDFAYIRLCKLQKDLEKVLIE